MRERLEELEEGEDVHNCECETDLPRPGHVIIGVFCHDCGGYMSHIGGDIDRQVEQLTKVQHIIHVAAAIDARDAVIAAEEAKTRHRGCNHPGCRPPEDDGGSVTVTMTEVYGNEGFRPFG